MSNSSVSNLPVFSYHHVSRSSDKLEATLAFYVALGCRIEKRVEDATQALTRVVLALPGSDAKLQLIARAGGLVSPPGLDWPDHLAFHTPDVQAALLLCLRSGADLVAAPYRTPSGSLVAFVSDPDGHRLELVQKPGP